jgi:hypothetical protein
MKGSTMRRLAILIIALAAPIAIGDNAPPIKPVPDFPQYQYFASCVGFMPPNPGAAPVLPIV